MKGVDSQNVRIKTSGSLTALKENPDNFDMRSSEFKELIQSDCKRNRKLERSLLSVASPQKRLNLCYVASARTPSQLTRGFRTVLRSRRVSEAELYLFTHESDKKEVRVSILCPTDPPLYVYYHNLRKNTDIHIMIPFSK